MSLRPLIAQRVEALCQRLGAALWQIQGVEEILAKYYSIVFKLSGAPSLEEIEDAFNKNFVHTCGRLVGLVRQQRGEGDPVAQRLSNFVDERAWVVHKLRRTDYLALREDAGFERALERVKAVEGEAAQLIELFHELLTEHFVGLGTPRELIEREQQKALREIYGE
jgi:hypothetical protein